MRKFLSLLLLATVSLAAAAEIHHGEMEMAFGWVRMPDGSRKDVTGMRIPFTAERIQAKVVSAVDLLKRPSQFPGVTASRVGAPVISQIARGDFSSFRFGPEALQKVYQNDSGGLYAILDPAEFEDPSSLDDCTMLPLGVGKAWKQLTMGYHWDGTNSSRIIIRWRIWDNNVEMPEGTNDFTGEFGDFGGYYTPGGAGTWKVTFDIAIIGCTAPDATYYMATQFRTDNPTGEGPFRMDYRNVYSNLAPPQTGSSLNQWWFDWENGADGIYENTEIDMLSDGFSNMLYAIEVDTNSQQLFAYPNSIVATKGTVKSGDNLSLWYDYDNDAVRYAEPRVNRLANPVAEIEVKSRLASSSISSLSLRTSARCIRLGAFYTIQIYRYGGGTPGWVNLGGNNTLTTVFQPLQYTYAGTIPLNQFLDSNRDVRMRIRFYRSSVAGPISPFEYYIDKVNWLYTSP